MLIERGTERAFTSPLYGEGRAGTYCCGACRAPLFSSATKYNSGTGWPSFYDALPNSVDFTVQARPGEGRGGEVIHLNQTFRLIIAKAPC